MKPFDMDMVRNYLALTKNRQPDFQNLLTVLHKQAPPRATLFEFYMNDELYLFLTGRDKMPGDPLARMQLTIGAFKAAGYDYCTISGSSFAFPYKASKHGQKSMSVNADVTIWDEESYERYVWPDPQAFDYSRLEKLRLPEGMKIISEGPGGVLENVIFLVGYDNLCYMLADEPELVARIVDDVGSRILQYYEITAQHDSVGALIGNDDWGFNSQTMLSLGDMRKYIFPWHKKIVKVMHDAGKPAILHSCGYFADIVDDIADDIGYDARHSYEDKIMTMEDAYDAYHDRFAILGGIDLDFLCRSAPEEIYERACAMLERTSGTGGYALGSGNSIPTYVPKENYLAMIAAATIGQ